MLGWAEGALGVVGFSVSTAVQALVPERFSDGHWVNQSIRAAGPSNDSRDRAAIQQRSNLFG